MAKDIGSRRGPVSLKSPQHGAEAHQTDRFSVKLSHLPKNIRLLHTLDDQAVLKTDVVEEAAFERALRRWRAVKAAGRRSTNRPAGQGDVLRRDDVVEFDVQIRKTLPHLTNRCLRVFPPHEPMRERGGVKVLPIHGLDEIPVDI